MNKIEKLQAALLKFNLKRTKAKMAPLLYELRMEMRAPGRKGEGFGVWCENNLTITRRTADLWANEWAAANGKPITFRKTSKGGLKARAAAKVYKLPSLPRPSWLTDDKEKQLKEALLIVGGPRALQLFFDAVTQAAAQHATVTNEAMAARA